MLKNKEINKIFDDLDEYRNFCRFEGFVFNENALYNSKDYNWQCFLKFKNKTKKGFVNRKKK